MRLNRFRFLKKIFSNAMLQSVIHEIAPSNDKAPPINTWEHQLTIDLEFYLKTLCGIIKY